MVLQVYLSSLHMYCSPRNSPAGVSPSLLPDSFCEGWLSDLGSRSPSPAGARIPVTGNWDEQRSSAGFFFFPDTWVRYRACS